MLTNSGRWILTQIGTGRKIEIGKTPIDKQGTILLDFEEPASFFDKGKIIFEKHGKTVSCEPSIYKLVFIFKE